MPSVVDINNLALGLIGDRATLTSIDPPEGSAQADHCARFWPIARDEALSMFDWGFARQTVSLAAQASEGHPNWEYAFALPPDFLVAREAVLGEDMQTTLYPGSPHFEIANNALNQPALYCNSEAVYLTYTRRVADPSVYPAKFVTGLSYLLASYLAGPIVKGRAGAQTSAAMRQMGEKLLGEAKPVDANQSSQSLSFKPASIRARRGSQTTIVERGQYRHELPFWAQ